MKTLKSKIIALAVCSALTASAFAAVTNSSDDATKATLSISITAIKPHSDSKSGGSGNTAPAPKTEQKIEYIVKEKMAQGLCSKWGSVAVVDGDPKPVCRFYNTYVSWHEYQHQVLATYVNGKRTNEQYMSDRCVYRKGKKKIPLKITMNKAGAARYDQYDPVFIQYAPSDYRRTSSRCQLPWDAKP